MLTNKNCFMRYFDFHCHIVLKQLFAEHPNIDTRINRKDVAGIPRICTDLPNIIETQIHQSQLATFGDEVIAGVVLYGLESYLSEQVIPLRKYLRPEAQYKMWLPLFQDIADVNKQPPYATFSSFTMERTLNKYLEATASFNVLTKDSFNSPLPKNKVNIYFVVEGCHSLVDTSLEAPLNHPVRKYPPDEILKNLDILLQKVKILSVNLTHLQQSNLSNHAFGMQLTSDTPFHPHGNGLTDDGRVVAQGLFDRGINIDLKHMSYKSRLDLRREIDEGKFKNVQHLNCTHAGFAGMPFSDWKGYIFQKRSVNDVYYIEIAKTMQTKNGPSRPGAPAFNSSTINLFDEEIVWIVKHGGMIGLSMDRRIIGYVDPFDDHPTGRDPESLLYVDKEYIFQTEWASLGLDNTIGYLINENDCVTEDDVKQSTEISIPARNEYYYDHILLQLKHFFQVCYDAGIDLKEAQKHITIGSDFDGMINPFINIDSVEEMPALKKYILMNFGYYLGSLEDSVKWKDQLDIPAFAEALFYENGFNYIRSFFQKF